MIHLCYKNVALYLYPKSEPIQGHHKTVYNSTGTFNERNNLETKLNRFFYKMDIISKSHIGHQS